MTTKKSLFAFAAAIATATLVPLSVLAAPVGSFQGAACGSGASGNYASTSTKGVSIFGKGTIFNTTIVGNSSEQRAGYELRISGLKPLQDGFGWQNCVISYLLPAGGNTSASDLTVVLHFNTGLTLSNTFAALGGSSKTGKWNTLSFTNRDFAGQGRTALLKRIVVYQKNTGSSTTQATFGDANAFHFNQGGITNGIIALQDGGCSDLDQNTGAPDGSVIGNGNHPR